jgi:hypothetical protein
VKSSQRVLDEYHALEARVRGALRDDLPEREFDALALDIHAFQLRHNRPLARWCRTLPAPSGWREIPAVPQAMFKRFRLSCFPPRLTVLTFRTSGTTGETRGEHHFASAALCEASVLAAWRRLRLPCRPALFLAEPFARAPDSSLSHMFTVLALEATVRAQFHLHAGASDLRTLAAQGPCAVFGTALAFLALFERMGCECVRLPRGSFAFETGGYKGSGRDIAKRDLYALFRERLGLAPDSIWNEYGMTELSSQAYTRGLGRPHEAPPWLRALVVDPETGKEAAVGKAGVLRLFDLANVGSVLAIQTADFAVRRTKGFELLGRDPAAVPRGCSRSADELLRGNAAADATKPVVASPSAMPTGMPPSRPGGPHMRSDSTRLAGPAPPRRGTSDLPDTAARARALAKAASRFPFLGKVTARGLLALVASELGHAAALDRFVPQGRRLVRAIAPGRILHVLSGNTPAAALQSLLRGLLLGSENFCKLPTGGIPEVDGFVSQLPRALAARVRLSQELPEPWPILADAAVIFGRDETIASLRAALPPGIPVLAHGHRLSVAAVFDDSPFRSVTAAARDVSVFDQQGCLSPHTVFVREKGALTAHRYAERLARAMAAFEKQIPRGPLTLSEANSIRALRDETAFRAANGEPLALLASEGTGWTVIVDCTAQMPLSPLNRVVFVKPLPADPAATLAPHRAHLSTCGIWPSTRANAEFAAALGFTRVCPLGRMQLPPLDWHHDGQPVLAPLVRWIDLETD